MMATDSAVRTAAVAKWDEAGAQEGGLGALALRRMGVGAGLLSAWGGRRWKALLEISRERASAERHERKAHGSEKRLGIRPELGADTGLLTHRTATG
jgi:hypothetical protein